MKIKLIFAWYDFWVGLFYDRKKRVLYIFPIPTVGIKLNFQMRKVAKVDECPICGSDDLFSFQQTHYKCRECDCKFTN
ncbi:hypothetical protein LCGC14_1496950 [marine sediment metagenome]|uniref:Uncharacterized protein n=1 Tax=marine sediment metagenome TaxID=412755 RepID=A0A0F9M6Q8_9ZZZZ